MRSVTIEHAFSTVKPVQVGGVSDETAVRRWFGAPRAVLVVAIALAAVPLLLPVTAAYGGQLPDGNYFGGQAHCGPAGLAAIGVGVDPGNPFRTLAQAIPPIDNGDTISVTATQACERPARDRADLAALLFTVGALVVLAYVYLDRRTPPPWRETQTPST